MATAPIVQDVFGDEIVSLEELRLRVNKNDAPVTFVTGRQDWPGIADAFNPSR
jgi:hypothetical protein